MALNLLRDSDDNIELDFPVTGNVDSPDFSIASIISTVSVKAIKNAVIYHYSPLGMFSLASGVFDLATALNFDPIEFEIQKNELNEETKKQLDKVVSLMSEKPRIKMVVCGEGTWLDYPDLTLEEIKQKKKEDFAKLDVTALLTLAKQRQSNVIKYIVEQGGIEKSRLLGCNVKMSKKKGAKPQVKLSI